MYELEPGFIPQNQEQLPKLNLLQKISLRVEMRAARRGLAPAEYLPLEAGTAIFKGMGMALSPLYAYRQRVNARNMNDK